MQARSKPRRGSVKPGKVAATVRVAGTDITVVSDAEAATADAVVVMPDTFASPFSDNLRGVCSSCGTGVIFRPHVPKNLPKLCIDCAVPLMAPPAGNA